MSNVNKQLVFISMFLDLVDFTDEEGYGKYLDLHECYIKYINLKGVDKVDYVTYLSLFDRLFDLSKEFKRQGEYRIYLQGMVDYLADYAARVQPVMDLDFLFHQIEADFEKDYSAGTFPGWPVRKFTPYLYFMQ